MKFFRLIILCLFFNVLHAADYQVEQNILYYNPQLDALDSYMRQQCRLDLYYPAGCDSFATVVWFHGGGMKAGERYIPLHLKEKGIAVVAVSYRLNPAVQCPEYIRDAAAAVAWTFQNIERYGGDANRIFVSGHSAGGYLAAMVGLDKKWLSHFDLDADRLAGIVPFSGHTITHMTVREEVNIPKYQPLVDEYAPLYHVRDDAPPLLLITGDRELELLGRYEENAYMARMMKVAGHQKTVLYEVEGFDHGSMQIPACYLLLKMINKK